MNIQSYLKIEISLLLLAPVLNMARHALKVHWLPVGIILLCTIKSIIAMLHFVMATLSYKLTQRRCLSPRGSSTKYRINSLKVGAFSYFVSGGGSFLYPARMAFPYQLYHRSAFSFSNLPNISWNQRLSLYLASPLGKNLSR